MAEGRGKGRSVRKKVWASEEATKNGEGINFLSFGESSKAFTQNERRGRVLPMSRIGWHPSAESFDWMSNH
jgi:hypothetical protein